jgi:hypothetical protein
MLGPRQRLAQAGGREHGKQEHPQFATRKARCVLSMAGLPQTFLLVSLYRSFS